jgi:UDP-glucose 4-epimerase
MKILITGGMGVIGSMVSTKFVQEGHRPVLMARHLDNNLIRTIKDKVDIELGDVSDLPRILSIIQKHGITHIIHMAALIGALSNQNPPQSVQINVMGTLNILEAARFMKVQRVIFSSAKGVYAATEPPHGPPTYKPITEDYPKDPLRIYDSAKLMGEHMGQFYRRTYGLDFAALRFSATYGLGKTFRHGGDKAVLNRLIEGAFTRKPTIIDKGGDPKNDFIYTKDAAYGVYLACIARKLNHSVYNIGTGVGVTVEDFAEEARKLFPGSNIEFRPGGSEGKPTYNCIYDISRARQDLDYSPQFTLRKSIEDYIETLQKLGMTADT